MYVHVGVFVLSPAEQCRAERPKNQNQEARPLSSTRSGCTVSWRPQAGSSHINANRLSMHASHPRLPLACRTPKGTRASQAASWLKRGSSK